MSTESSGKCARCGGPLPKPTELCPRCLMALNLATQTDVSEGSAAVRPARPAPPAIETLAPHFPQLELLELIGQGGMGAVYKARQRQLDRVVALKVLPPGIGADPAFAQRFEREAKAMARLNHPGIVTIHEFGHAGELFYFLMEFVDGVTLRQLLAAGRLAPREALAIVPQICDALQYAHDEGVVHRDIKPENILLDRRGRVKVADFGLAKLVGGTEDLAGGGGSNASAVLTQAGKVMGTPHYMAPEQETHPAEVDHRADIYGLGVVLYQMLTGELPGTPLEPPSRKVQLDVRLDEIVLRALETSPERRYAQASDVKTALDTLTTPPPAAEAPATPPAPGKWRRIGLLVMGFVLFGFLMGVREEFQSLWLRTGLAAGAAVILMLAIVRFRRKLPVVQGRPRLTVALAVVLATVISVFIVGTLARHGSKRQPRGTETTIPASPVKAAVVASVPLDSGQPANPTRETLFGRWAFLDSDAYAILTFDSEKGYDFADNHTNFSGEAFIFDGHKVTMNVPGQRTKEFRVAFYSDELTPFGKVTLRYPLSDETETYRVFYRQQEDRLGSWRLRERLGAISNPITGMELDLQNNGTFTARMGETTASAPVTGFYVMEGNALRFNNAKLQGWSFRFEGNTLRVDPGTGTVLLLDQVKTKRAALPPQMPVEKISVTGHITDNTGKPIPGAQVFLRTMDGPFNVPHPNAWQTDGQGQFACTVTKTQLASFAAVAEGYSYALGGTNLTLWPEGLIRGKVVDEFGHGVIGATITLDNYMGYMTPGLVREPYNTNSCFIGWMEDREPFEITTGPGGVFVLEHLPQLSLFDRVSLQLLVTKTNHAPMRYTLSKHHGELEGELQLRCPVACKAEGTLRFPEGVPPASRTFEVSATWRDGADKNYARSFEWCKVGPTGEFRLQDLPPGTIEFLVHEEDPSGSGLNTDDCLFLTPVRSLEVQPGVTNRLEISMQRGATVQGIVLDSQTGKPASVELRVQLLGWGEEGSSPTVYSDWTGKFAFRAPAGEVRIGMPLSYDSTKSSEMAFTVQDGEVKKDIVFNVPPPRTASRR